MKPASGEPCVSAWRDCAVTFAWYPLNAIQDRYTATPDRDPGTMVALPRFHAPWIWPLLLLWAKTSRRTFTGRLPGADCLSDVSGSVGHSPAAIGGDWTFCDGCAASSG